jgi:hypothetical protein
MVEQDQELAFGGFIKWDVLVIEVFLLEPQAHQGIFCAGSTYLL